MPVVLNLDQIKSPLKKIDPVEGIIPSHRRRLCGVFPGKCRRPAHRGVGVRGTSGGHPHQVWIHPARRLLCHQDRLRLLRQSQDGPPTSSGLTLLFSQKRASWWRPDRRRLPPTQVRTAAAGAVVGKYFAPKKVKRVGIFGAGVQGRMQLEYLRYVRDFEDVIVWGVNQEELDRYKADMTPLGSKSKRPESPRRSPRPRTSLSRPPLPTSRS